REEMQHAAVLPRGWSRGRHAVPKRYTNAVSGARPHQHDGSAATGDAFPRRIVLDGRLILEPEKNRGWAGLDRTRVKPLSGPAGFPARPASCQPDTAQHRR